jgi:DNA polymerase III alpha subunit
VLPPDQTSLLDDLSWPQPPVIEAESTRERAAEEYATLGFTVSVDHPLALYAAELEDTPSVCAARLGQCVGRQVTVMGVVVAGRRIRTRGDRPMAFASVCDRTGTMELTFYDAAAQRYADTLHVGSVLVASGMVTEHLEHGIGVEVRHARALVVEPEADYVPG